MTGAGVGELAVTHPASRRLRTAVELVQQEIRDGQHPDRVAVTRMAVVATAALRVCEVLPLPYREIVAVVDQVAAVHGEGRWPSPHRAAVPLRLAVVEMLARPPRGAQVAEVLRWWRLLFDTTAAYLEPAPFRRLELALRLAARRVPAPDPAEAGTVTGR